MVSFAEIKDRRNEILNIANKYGIHNVRVFGSVARGEQAKDSDLDLVVTMDKDRSMLDRIGFMQEVEDLLHVKVDVVNENALHKLIRESVLQEGVEL